MAIKQASDEAAQWITPETVRTLLSLSNSTIRRRRKVDVNFPKPVFLSPTSTRYLREEVLAYKATLEAKRDGMECERHNEPEQIAA